MAIDEKGREKLLMIGGPISDSNFAEAVVWQRFAAGALGGMVAISDALGYQQVRFDPVVIDAIAEKAGMYADAMLREWRSRLDVR
jgi:hypothetical protein